MHPKKLIAGATLAVVGVAAGAILTVSANAADEAIDISPPWFRYLSEEQQAEVETKMEAERTLAGSIEREVVKTDDGLRITLRSDNAEAVEMMHERYDQSDGEFPGFGMFKGGPGPRGMRLHLPEDNTTDTE
jgi:hypothetical protein